MNDGPISDGSAAAEKTPGLARHLLKLARPKQWAKCGFVLIGPMYGYADGKTMAWAAALCAAIAFALAASACYVYNDLRDRDADRQHLRKRRRPIASGAVSTGVARIFGFVLILLGAAAVALMPGGASLAFAAVLGIYVINVLVYSAAMKHIVILDVISLACGFVLRVVGGCVATGIEPSPWLLNCTFFLAMFLSLGKRLGERRTMSAMGSDAASVRGVQSIYTDDLLRMSVVVTAVATLITYAGYVEDRAMRYWTTLDDLGSREVESASAPKPGKSLVAVVEGSPPSAGDSPASTVIPNESVAHAHPSAPQTSMSPSHARWKFYLLWITMLPATYGLLRCIVMLERGVFDDPTELVAGDRPVQAAVLLFGAITIVLVGIG